MAAGTVAGVHSCCFIFNAQLKFFEAKVCPEHCDVSSARCLTDLDLTKLCWTSSSKRVFSLRHSALITSASLLAPCYDF